MKAKVTADLYTLLDVTVPGERWEIDLLRDGSIEIEVCKSDGTIHGEPRLEELFRRFSN
jgi:hypothetical protein